MTAVEERRRRVMRALVAVHDFLAERDDEAQVEPFHVRWFGLDDCKALDGIDFELVRSDLRWLVRGGYAERVAGRWPVYKPTTEGRVWIAT